MKPIYACLGLLLAALLFTSCDDLLMSKEERQMDSAIRQAITANPSGIDAPFADGEPPLHIALTYHLPALFNWLLDHGADPNARDTRSKTALRKAVIFDSPDHRAMRALIKRGANVNSKEDDGATPLHLAAFLSRASAAEVLLAARADPNARDRYGKTPLHNAATPQPTASPENAARTIHLLVASGADPNAHKANGNTPLHQAALIGSVLATRTLLSEGAQVDAPGMGGETALHVAAQFGKADVAEVLLKAGADPNRLDNSGLTPLARALHYPAVTANAQGAGNVDTSAVVEVLRRYKAIDQGASRTEYANKARGGDLAAPGYTAYWLTSKALGEYVDLILARRPLIEMPKGPAPANKPLLDRDGIVVRTYAKDSIWNIDKKPFKPVAEVERVEADTLTIHGREFEYTQARLEDVLKLLEDPDGKIPVHRIYGPISGQEEIVKSLAQTIKRQLTEKQKELNRQ